jgi:hypothetical protein
MNRWSVCTALLPVMMYGTLVAQEPRKTPMISTDVRSAEISPKAARELLSRPVTLTLSAVAMKPAIDSLAARAGVSISYYSDLVEGTRKPAPVRFVRVPLGEALEQLLSGTHLAPVVIGANRISIVDVRSSVVSADGTITGTVTDASTRRPLRDVAVLLDGTTRGVRTDGSGQFRVTGVSAGQHRLRFRLIGYSSQQRSVTVSDGASATVDVALSSSTSVLEQVVVTGTVIPTELKAVPNAITVITAKQLEERGITQIQQLFRGDVPGLFALNSGSSSIGSSGASLDDVGMYSRGATRLAFSAFDASGTTNVIKTYVDGVEMADPKYMSQIDPKSIDRIGEPHPVRSTLCRWSRDFFRTISVAHCRRPIKWMRPCRPSKDALRTTLAPGGTIWVRGRLESRLHGRTAMAELATKQGSWPSI